MKHFDLKSINNFALSIPVIISILFSLFYLRAFSIYLKIFKDFKVNFMNYLYSNFLIPHSKKCLKCLSNLWRKESGIILYFFKRDFIEFFNIIKLVKLRFEAGLLGNRR